MLTFKSVVGMTLLVLLIAQIPAPVFADQPRLNGRLVYVHNSFIYSSKLDGTDAKQLTSTVGDVDYKPKVSPDGTRIVFVKLIGQEANDREVYVMNADGSNQTRLTRSVGRDEAPNWTHDNRIVFESARDGNTEIFIMNADGSNQTQLTFTPNTVNNSSPAVSPDNNKVFISSNVGGSNNIYSIQLSAPSIPWVQYTFDTAPTNNGAPIVSADGQKLVFAAGDKPGHVVYQRLYVLDLATNTTRMLTEPGTNYSDQFPSFDATDSEVYFTSNRVGNVVQNFKININGGAAQQVTGIGVSTPSNYPSVQHLMLGPVMRPGGITSVNLAVGQKQATFDVLGAVLDAYGSVDPSTVSITKAPTQGTATVDNTTGTITYVRNEVPNLSFTDHVMAALFAPAYAASNGDTIEYQICSSAHSALCSRFSLAISFELPVLQPPSTGTMSSGAGWVQIVAVTALIVTGFGATKRYIRLKHSSKS